jgi:hypothetical protein
VPRGITVLAGGTAPADAVEFSLAADLGGNDYTIGANQYLAKRASPLSYRATITANADGTWSYDQVTMLKMSEFPRPFAHADRNTLHRVASTTCTDATPVVVVGCGICAHGRDTFGSGPVLVRAPLTARTAPEAVPQLSGAGSGATRSAFYVEAVRAPCFVD